MRLSHFNALAPVCPACRSLGREDSELALTTVEAEKAEDVESGILGCRACGTEYPIIDGLPIIVPDVRRFVADNLFYLLSRKEMTPAVEGLIGDMAGAESALQSIRQHLSSYVWDHWGDLDPHEDEEAPGAARPGSMLRALDCGWPLLSEDIPDGPLLDIGCGPGRGTVELASHSGRMVLGIDLSVPLARVARTALATGVVEYPRRRLGLAYERRRFSVAPEASPLGDVWMCDIMALPFAPSTFARAIAMNVLDCVSGPRRALAELGRVLKPESEALLALPFDWTGHVTPVDEWLGGRSRDHLTAENALTALLSDPSAGDNCLQVSGSPIDVPWHVRLHDRSCMHYSVHLMAVRKRPS